MKERISFRDVPQGLMTSMLLVGKQLKETGLDEKLLELVEFRVSQINGCAFCLDMHYKDAIHHGETEQRLYSLPAWRDCPWYSDAERAVLAYTESLTTSADVNDAVFNDLALYFNHEEIAVLTFAIAMTGTWNRLNKAFHTIPGGYRVGQFA